MVTGDIGCYTLAVLPPLLAIDTTGCMGASIGKALGMEKAGLPNKVVAVIGDSTFLHSGITPLLDVVYNGGTITILILDNRTTAMTGHQEHPGTGLSAQGEPARAVDLERLVRGLGVEDVQVVDAFDLAALEAALRDSVERDEPSVVIVRGACALKVRAAGEACVVDRREVRRLQHLPPDWAARPSLRRDGKAAIEPGRSASAPPAASARRSARSTRLASRQGRADREAPEVQDRRLAEHGIARTARASDLARSTSSWPAWAARGSS